MDPDELTRLFQQLQDAQPASPSIHQFIQQLSAQADSQEAWRQQVQEARATLDTERINFGKTRLGHSLAPLSLFIVPTILTITAVQPEISEQRLLQHESKFNAFKSQLSATRQKLQDSTNEAQNSGTWSHTHTRYCSTD